MSNLYEADLYAWANEQAALLRAGQFDRIDVANIAEEIEALARSERRELINRLAVLLTHLLKWQAQPSYQSRSWVLAVTEQRLQLRWCLDENPSLEAKLSEAVHKGYEDALLAAQRETGLAASLFPLQCPWSMGDILREDFLP